MASLCGRMLLQNSRRSVLHTSVRYKEKRIPKPLELATGLEKREILAHLAGNTDPFNLEPVIRGPSTKDNPTLVPSCFDSRLVGCVCHEEATAISWMWLHAGSPRRCECGYWFQLSKKEPL